MDANMAPSTFAANADIATLGGRVVTCADGTCRVRESWSNVDYFLVDKRLGSLVPRAFVVDSWHAHSHRPVCLELGLGIRALRTRPLAAPRRFPPVLPVGCERAVDAPWAAALGAPNVDTCYRRCVGALERELAGRFDLVGAGGTVG